MQRTTRGSATDGEVIDPTGGNATTALLTVQPPRWLQAVLPHMAAAVEVGDYLIQAALRVLVLIGLVFFGIGLFRGDLAVVELAVSGVGKAALALLKRFGR